MRLAAGRLGDGFGQFCPDKVEKLPQRCLQVITQVTLLNLGFGPIVEMLGSGYERREIRRVIIPVYQPTLSSMLPVKRISVARRIDPEVNKGAIAKMEA